MWNQSRATGLAGRLSARAKLMVMGMTVVGAASGAPYNPQHLSAVQLDQVAEICRTVMGFEPSRPLFENLWPGSPDPEALTNNYRGCVASLAGFLISVPTVWAKTRAQDECQAKGLTPGSSELGLCELRAVEATSGRDAVETPSLVVTPCSEIGATSQPPATASATRRRQRTACAEIGLVPVQSAFESCVHDLDAVLIAERMSALYQNR